MIIENMPIWCNLATNNTAPPPPTTKATATPTTTTVATTATVHEESERQYIQQMPEYLENMNNFFGCTNRSENIGHKSVAFVDVLVLCHASDERTSERTTGYKYLPWCLCFLDLKDILLP